MSTSAVSFASDRNNSVLMNGGKRVQAKLQVNEPGDVYEQEADAMADRVMQMQPSNENSSANPVTGLIGKSVQRKCAHCEEEEKRRVMRKESGAGGTTVSSSFSASLQTSKAGGAALPATTRSKMENAFGADFSDVKIHADSKAAEMSRGINAKAFTYGSDIYFNEGEYSAGTDQGQRLLAHELTHVVQQQSGSSYGMVQRLGANNGCDATQTAAIHQAIFDARGWINNMLSRTSVAPITDQVRRALRRNFGPTYGVPENLTMIVDRIRLVYRLLSSLTIDCDPGTNAACVNGNCGFAFEGSRLATICPHTITTGGNYLIGCVLHETFHAAFSRFSVDEYSGWHGTVEGTPGYPGLGVDPLLNADSYTTFVMDLS